MSWELFIAFRYLKFNKRHIYLNICNLLAGLGIFLGVLSLVLVISMMNGLEGNIRDVLFSYQPDITVSRGSLPISADTFSGIKSANADYKYYKVYKLPLIAKSNMTYKGIELCSVDSDYIRNILGLKQKREEFLFLGRLLSMELQIKKGDTLELLMPFAKNLNAVPVKITDTFESRLVDIDMNNIYIERKMFLSLFDIGSELNEIHIDDIPSRREINRLKDQLNQKLGENYTVSTIFEKNHELFSAMKLERIAMIIMLSIIILLGCFNIISSLLMLVTEKIQDIGILRAVGGRNGSIMRIFAFQGVFIGLLSTASGLASGIVLSILFDKYRLISASSQGLYLDYIPFRVDFPSILIIFILSLAINLISTYIPTKNISDINIIKALYYGK